MTVEISAVGGSGTVSPTSPLGSALLGRKPGERSSPGAAWLLARDDPLDPRDRPRDELVERDRALLHPAATSVSTSEAVVVPEHGRRPGRGGGARTPRRRRCRAARPPPPTSTNPPGRSFRSCETATTATPRGRARSAIAGRDPAGRLVRHEDLDAIAAPAPRPDDREHGDGPAVREREQAERRVRPRDERVTPGVVEPARPRTPGRRSGGGTPRSPKQRQDGDTQHGRRDSGLARLRGERDPEATAASSRARQGRGAFGFTSGVEATTAPV